VFSSLPKLADKAFIVGYLAPVLLALLAALIVFPEFSWTSNLLKTLTNADDLGKVTLAAASSVFAALLLMLANRPIYRALEGYIGPLSLPFFEKRAQHAWATREEERRRLLRKAQAAPVGRERDDAKIAYRKYLRAFRRRYPRSLRNVLPTKFGNANRAFEAYSASVYGVEAILIWPRLTAILPKAQEDLLSDARAQVNFFCNICALSALIFKLRFLIWAFEGLSWVWRHGVNFSAPPDVMAIGGDAVLWTLIGFIAWGSYEMAVEQAIAMGDQVRVAFDIFLHQLPAKLGYVYPCDEVGRGKFWAALEEAYDFHNPVVGVKFAAEPAAESPSVGENAAPEAERTEADDPDPAGEESAEPEAPGDAGDSGTETQSPAPEE